MDNILNSDFKGAMIQLKKAPYKKGYKFWFWHKKRGMIIGKSGLKKPYQKLLHLQECLEPTEKIDRQEIQIGDTCCIKFRELDGFIFVHVIGYDGKDFIYQYNNKKILRNLIIEEHEVISSNIIQRNIPVRKNLVNAQIEEELDFIEKINFRSATETLYKHIYDPEFSITESTFIGIHRMIFEGIYDWAGQVRYKSGEEIVIGSKEYPTMHPLEVPKTLTELFHEIDIFNMCDEINKNQLVILLAKVHTRLAWIHPFKDGNGRCIRLFCEFIALKFDYILEFEKMTKKDRQYYIYAVRSSVNNKKNHLCNLINRYLKRNMI